MRRRLLGAALAVAAAGCFGGDQVGPFQNDSEVTDFYQLSEISSPITVSATWSLGATGPGYQDYKGTLTVTNAGADTIAGLTSPRLWRVRLYATAARSGDPIWEGWTDILQDPEGTISLTIPPGSSFGFSEQPGAFIPRINILSSPVSAGTYYVSAALAFFNPAQRTGFVDAGTVELTDQ